MQCANFCHHARRYSARHTFYQIWTYELQHIFSHEMKNCGVWKFFLYKQTNNKATQQIFSSIQFSSNVICVESFNWFKLPFNNNKFILYQNSFIFSSNATVYVVQWYIFADTVGVDNTTTSTTVSAFVSWFRYVDFHFDFKQTCFHFGFLSQKNEANFYVSAATIQNINKHNQRNSSKNVYDMVVLWYGRWKLSKQ